MEKENLRSSAPHRYLAPDLGPRRRLDRRKARLDFRHKRCDAALRAVDMHAHRYSGLTTSVYASNGACTRVCMLNAAISAARRGGGRLRVTGIAVFTDQ